MDAVGSQTDLLVRLLQAAELRAQTVAGNLANENTPGYTRRTVRFEEHLRAAARNSEPLTEVSPEVVLDTESPARPDGNNVSLELELNELRENRILYETYAAILQGHFELLRTAISSGR